MSAASAFARGGTGTVSRRDGAAGQVCLRERIPGTPQPAGVRPGYERAAGSLPPYAKEKHSPLSSALLLSSKGYEKFKYRLRGYRVGA